MPDYLVKISLLYVLKRVFKGTNVWGIWGTNTTGVLFGDKIFQSQ